MTGGVDKLIEKARAHAELCRIALSLSDAELEILARDFDALAEVLVAAEARAKRLREIARLADMYANWNDPRIEPTAEIPDARAALAALRSALAAGGVDKLIAQERDTRLREEARETIRYELEGAAKDGLTPNDDWDRLAHGRDVLALLRERDELAAALFAAGGENPADSKERT